MNAREEGYAVLSRQLDRWVAEYSESCCDRPVSAAQGSYPIFIFRLWRCWRHHWRQAAQAAPQGRVDAREVAERIRSGRGYSGGGDLGGDPLRDVVLAVAVQLRDNRATACFQSEYSGFSQGLAGKLHARLRRRADDWWDEFVDFLAGYSVPPGKLERFEGKCALRNWLGTVLWNFLKRWGRKHLDSFRTYDEARDGSQEPPPDPDLQRYLDLFGELVRAALDKLPKEDRLLLSLLFVDGLKLKDAAAILGKHAGSAGRQRDKALDGLRELLEHGAGGRESAAYRECLESISMSPREFADALVEALRRSCQEEDES